MERVMTRGKSLAGSASKRKAGYFSFSASLRESCWRGRIQRCRPPVTLTLEGDGWSGSV